MSQAPDDLQRFALRGRGLGMQCPEQVSALLRAAGWRGYNGWWLQEIHGASQRMRWYEAVSSEMRGDTSSRKRKADTAPAPLSCAKTVDMFPAEINP